MKKNIKGVTLIALVVTIIVLLILGTVSIRLVTKHQVIDITAKQRFTTEVTQIYEQLKEERLALEMLEREDDRYNIKFEDLDIGDKLKNKYTGKLKVESGNLVADSGLTDQEKEWFTGINIGKFYIPYNRNIKCALFPDTSLDGKNKNTDSSDSPTIWFDETGNGYNGTLLKHKWAEDGGLNVSYYGNKENNPTQLAIPGALNGKKEYTIAFCVKSNNYWGVGSPGRCYINFNSYKLNYESSVLVYSDYGYGVKKGTITPSGATIPNSTGKRNVIVLTCNGEKIDIYIGTESSPTYVCTYTPNDTNNLTINTDIILAQNIPAGKFSYAILWDRELSSEDIAKLTPDLRKISDMK